MSRMLEALKQIQANPPETRPAVKPISPEELEAFGLRRPAQPTTQESSEPVETVEPAGPVEPAEAVERAQAVESAEMAQAVEPIESAEPVESADVVQAPEPVESAEPVDSSEPAESAEPAEVVETAEVMETAEVVETAEAAETAEVAQPAGAAQPAPPVDTVPPSERVEENAVLEQIDEPGGDVAVAENEVGPAEVADAAGRDRGADRLIGLPAEEHLQPYRELADNVLTQLSPSRPAVLMFTSAADGEGKTATLASLAPVLAQRVEDEIVAVDANFRNPQLAGRFGIPGDRGLGDVVTGAASWRDVVRKTDVDRLSILPGGRFALHEGRAPQSGDLARVLEALLRRYRIVLLDAASLSHPEVGPMSELCEGTYLVIRLGRTGRRAAREAVRVIRRCGGRVLGCVLTGVPADA